jgi:3-phenylpropionate/cinnamic acid dioxygenase small subunit
VNRYELRSDIENFLYTEAELLDERRFTEWLDLLAEELKACCWRKNLTVFF